LNNTEYENDIRRFLFGEMPEAERSAFEERFLTDAGLFERITAAEEDLIEKYVRERMTPAERSRFERNFLATEARRERVEFMRRFLQKIDERRERTPSAGAAAAGVSGISRRERLSRLFLTPQFAAAFVFLFLLTGIGSWLVYRSLVTPDEELAVRPDENINITPPVLPSTPAAIDLNRNVSVNKPENSSEETKEPAKTPTPRPLPEKPTPTPAPTKTPAERIAPNPILALFARTLRSDGQIKTLELPENARGATLRLNPESVEYGTFRADLTDAEGRVIYRRDALNAKNKRIDLFIPARNLKRGDYLIRLYGRNENGEYESAADFQFRVNR
jgi:hypothetical protein